MRRILRIGRRHPSPAMVVACMALFIALGGTSYAVSQINGDQILKRSIDGSKLKVNDVGAKEIKESGLKTSFAGLADNSIALGGTPAAAHARNVEVVENATGVSSPTVQSATATCPAGKLVIGGGGAIDPTANGQDVALRASAPNADRTAWVATAFEVGTGTNQGYLVRAFAVCANR